MSSKDVRVANSLLRAAGEAQRQAEPHGAIMIYDEVIHQFGQATSADVLERVATALYEKAMLLSELEDLAQEIATYRELADRFGQHPAEPIQLLVAEGLINLSYTFQDYDRDLEAINACQTIIQLYSHTDSGNVREYVEKAADLIAEWEAERA